MRGAKGYPPPQTAKRRTGPLGLNPHPRPKSPAFGARRQEAPWKDGILYYGLPAYNSVTVQIGTDGRPGVGYPNIVVLPPLMKQALAQVSRQHFHDPGRPPDLTGVRWIMNMCADAMDHEASLMALEAILAGGEITVFNHPSAVLKTRRDRAEELLGGIDGLKVPRCTRFEPKMPEDFAAHFRDNGFSYPVLIRAGATQAGEALARINGPDDWDRIFTVPWIGRTVFMTQFVDTRRANGRYVKLRPMVTGGHMTLRHVAHSDHWLVHANVSFRRVDDYVMPTEEETERDWQFLKSVVGKIDERVRLDYYGMDLGMLDDGSFVLFECNAAMSAVSPKNLMPEKRDVYLPILEKFGSRLADCILAKGIPLYPPKQG